MDVAYLTNRRAAELPVNENELSRRCLRMLEAWAPVGAEYFADWPGCPHCGHFLGGVHWYGMETSEPVLAFAAMAASPELDERVAGLSRAQIREMAVKGLRYLCYTHDAGPADCVRPEKGLGREENEGRKWGERGRGFFPESQCGRTISALVIAAMLLGDAVDDETRDLLGEVCLDYVERFADMEPKSGVYDNTQTEENAWTADGLYACTLYLAGHPKADQWMKSARQWMFSTAVAPQDMKNQAEWADGRAARDWTQRKATLLPDYVAENHGMVHPTYTASAIAFSTDMACTAGVFGDELPAEASFNRERVYRELRRITDERGSFHPVQGMDWPYHAETLAGVPTHAYASVFFGDADAARLERAALDALEYRSRASGGRILARDVGEHVADIQDPMIVRECQIGTFAYTYLLHRLHGAGARPAPDDSALRGARVYSHSGFAHLRHGRGQTSFSWRNNIMALATDSDGVLTIAPATGSLLADVTVRGRPDSHDLQSIRVDEQPDSFAVALDMRRAQGSVRQTTLFAVLPDGRTALWEQVVAEDSVIVERADHGLVRVINERYDMPDGLCRGERVLHTPDGAETFRGYVSDDPASDFVREYGHPAWVNVDDRVGIVFSGTGATEYTNRHYFKPWWAVADDLVLSRMPVDRQAGPGEVVTGLSALICPDQAHEDTPLESYAVLRDGPAVALLVGAECLVAGNFGDESRTFSFHRERLPGDAVPVFPGASNVGSDAITWRVELDPGEAVLLEAVAGLSAEGAVDIACAGGNVFAEAADGAPATVTRDGVGQEIAAGEVRAV